jgi:hypothetical protein
MKYAFIMGSNSFIVPSNTLVYQNNDQAVNFLKIISFNQYMPVGYGQSALEVDLDITDASGHSIKFKTNHPRSVGDFQVTEQPDRLLITRADGTAVIDVHQLDEDTAMGLEHNIIAELEALAPEATIRVRGNFKVNDLHIEIDNEKLFVNGNAYANSTLTGKGNLQFTSEGVVI